MPQPPLAGWRRAVLWTYAVLAGGLLFGLLRDVGPVFAAFRPPWLGTAAILAVPFTLVTAAALSRLLPVRRGGRFSQSTQICC